MSNLMRAVPALCLIFSLAGCSSCVNKAKPPAALSPDPAASGTGEEVREFPQKAAAGTAARVRPVKVREAAVAGSWYPGERSELARYLDRMLGGKLMNASVPRMLAMVSPHAGYKFSGKGAAAGYKWLRELKNIDRVVVLAVSHRVPFRGASIADVTHYETPLGRIPVDTQAVARLRKLKGLVSALPEAHRQEHSLEMQLPMLQRALPGGFLLVPILLSQMTPADHDKLAVALREVLDPNTLVVASSDFTHRGPNYSYEVPAGDGDVKARLKAIDGASARLMVAMDRDGLLAHAARTGSTICGLQPVAQLLTLLGGVEGVKGRVGSHYTSGDVTGDWTNTVTYITVAYSGRWPTPKSGHGGLDWASSSGLKVFPLPATDRQTLLQLARSSLESAVRSGGYEAGPLGALNLTDSLRRKAGAFVTLKCRLGPGSTCAGPGEGLRGCIGSIAPTNSVISTVAQRAASAALEDPRFPSKVSPGELKHIRVEVSVLTPPRPISGPDKFQVGRHGVILSKGRRSATFLPQVAPEQGWDRETTLRHLSMKAGLGADGWKDAELQVYEGIVFGEMPPR